MNSSRNKHQLVGGASAIGAFIIWGVSPVYWKTLDGIPPLQITAHRVVWSAMLLIILVGLRNQWRTLGSILRNRKYVGILIATALLLSTNWLAYIWAVSNGFVRQASLGYYITPLVNVVLGMLFLRERLTRAQSGAVILAAVAVTALTVLGGVFPTVSLVLACSFGSYGLLRKKAPIDPLVGLTIETIILFAPAIAYLGFCLHRGEAHFSQIDGMLLASSVVTATPLLLFNFGAKRLRLSTIGLMQYLAPTCMFLLAVFVYREPFTKEEVLAFIVIWTALAIYTADSLRSRPNQAASPKDIEPAL
jgi:chloramphenicol-sensitive protein RarD